MGGAWRDEWQFSAPCAEVSPRGGREQQGCGRDGWPPLQLLTAFWLWGLGLPLLVAASRFIPSRGGWASLVSSGEEPQRDDAAALMPRTYSATTSAGSPVSRTSTSTTVASSLEATRLAV